MRCTERAYAKINLTLDVGAKRADGYHEITSVMQRISLWDTVTVERGTGCDSLLCSVPVTEDVNDNLCMKALRVFFTETAMESGGVSITLEKHIPTQAGLGGGSSDAAAVLLALRTLYAPRMTDMRLERLAEKLGSKPGNMGFLLPAMGKEQLFKTVMADGVLPRKTFSMGHAQDKRYYIEARKIVK